MFFCPVPWEHLLTAAQREVALPAAVVHAPGGGRTPRRSSLGYGPSDFKLWECGSQLQI